MLSLKPELWFLKSKLTRNFASPSPGVGMPVHHWFPTSIFARLPNNKYYLLLPMSPPPELVRCRNINSDSEDTA